MKRSNMLSKMVECYLTCTEDLKYTPDKAMDRVLEVLEDNGMLPPRWENPNPDVSDRFRSSDADWNNGKLRMNSWEPEETNEAE